MQHDLVTLVHCVGRHQECMIQAAESLHAAQHVLLLSALHLPKNTHEEG